jgi:diadenosine tetraphosphate (Ap4A) HIT family hydrolase
MFELHPQLAKDCIVVCDLSLCRVLLANDSQYPWLILVPMKNAMKEIIDLSEQEQQLLWQESAKISRILQSLYSPDKLNVAALGNMLPQLHMHHIARFTSDAAWPAPIWGVKPAVAYTGDKIEEIKAAVLGLV